MEERSGWSVPGYVAEELIGFGAAGEVWRGRSVRTGDVVALKRLRSVAGDGGARLRREATLLAAFDHPHVLGVREIVETERMAVLVLDYAAGGSLAMLLRRRGRLRPGEVITVLAPVAAALAHAHDEGLIHGDVTPANVLFRADGRPLLADLGVARLIGERHDPLSAPEYVDPAVAAGAAPGPGSDVFMLAAVALHALTGEPPWSTGTPEQALATAAAGRHPDLDALVEVAPEPLVRPLRRALSARPEDRGTAAELALDMRHGCRPEPVLPLPDPGATRAVSASASTAPPGRVRRESQTVARGSEPGAPGTGLTHTAGGRPDGEAGVGERPADAAGSPAPGDLTAHAADEPSAAALTQVVRVAPAQRAGADSLPAGPRHRWQAGPADDPGPGWRRGRVLAVAAGLLVTAALGGVAWGVARPAERAAEVTARPAEPDVAASTRQPPGRPAARPAKADSEGAGHPAPAAASPAGPPRSAADWLVVLDRLDAIRARAYETGDITLLGRVYAPGGHLAADTRQLRRVLATGDRVRGVRHLLRVVSVQAQTAGRTTLRVAQSLRPSVRVHSGRVVAGLPGTTETVIVVDLVRTDAGWRLA